MPRSVWFQRPSAQVSSFWLPQCPATPPSSPGNCGSSGSGPFLLAEVLGLLGVEVVDPVAIDRLLPARPLLGVERRPVEGKLGAGERVPHQHGGLSSPPGRPRSSRNRTRSRRSAVDIASASPSGISVPSVRSSSISASAIWKRSPEAGSRNSSSVAGLAQLVALADLAVGWSRR